jgi:hypothetical protein
VPRRVRIGAVRVGEDGVATRRLAIGHRTKLVRLRRDATERPVPRAWMRACLGKCGAGFAIVHWRIHFRRHLLPGHDA